MNKNWNFGKMKRFEYVSQKQEKKLYFYMNDLGIFIEVLLKKKYEKAKF